MHLRVPFDVVDSGNTNIVGIGENCTVWVSYNDGKGNFGSPVRLTDEFGLRNGEWGLKALRFMTNSIRICLSNIVIQRCFLKLTNRVTKSGHS